MKEEEEDDEEDENPDNDDIAVKDKNPNYEN